MASDDSLSPVEKRARAGMLSGVVGIALNLLLFASKLAVGIFTGYVSITADAFNNLTDGFSSVVSFVSFRLSEKPADKNHPFGHQRVEYAASMAVAFFVLLIAWELGTTAVKDVFHPPEMTKLNTVGALVLGASVPVKLFMFFMNRRLAKSVDSGLLRAAAVDSVSDAAATSVVILCAVVSPRLDGYAGLVIAALIAKAGIGIVRESVDGIIGVKPDPALSKGILDYVRGFDGVLGAHDLIIHQYGPNRSFLSLHVEVDGRNDVFATHEMIDGIETGIYEKFGVSATLHMDPVYPEDEFWQSLQGYAATVLAGLDGRLTLHDFRIVQSEVGTSVAFDVIKPYDVKLSDDEILQRIKAKFSELNKDYKLSVVIDREFT